MCDYSLHAVRSRAAVVGEELVSTTFRGTSTRGLASPKEPAVAVCLLPGTELAFEENVRYDNRWLWTREINQKVGKFAKVDPTAPQQHHDAIEFPDGSHILLTELVEGQKVKVLQLPVTRLPAKLSEETQVLPEGDLGIRSEGWHEPAE